MSESRDILHNFPLINFLNAYPEPAFILCTSSAPHLTLDFIYGNDALSGLVFGQDESGILDSDTFFTVVTTSDDLVWLSNPVNSQPGSTAISEARTISIRPSWLPRDHTPLDLELVPTPIDLPVTIPEIGSSSKSHVFIAVPRKASLNLLRSGSSTRSDAGKRRDSGAKINDPPPLAASIGQRRSRKSKSQSSSRPSQLVHASDSVLMPSKLIHVFPWEQTTLGARSSWPWSLEVMVRYVMEKPIPSTVYWGWPHLVMIYNDAYARMISLKHPAAFGQPGAIVWGEIWEMLSPVASLCHQGKATMKTDDLLFWNTLTELHLPEEFYHSWHWTPVWQEDGTVGGVFNSTYDTTQKVIAERRLAGMTEIFSSLADVRTADQYAERILAVLARNPLDIPFVALYWCDVENTRNDNSDTKKTPLAAGYLRHFYSTMLIDVTLTLAGSIGIPEGHPAGQKIIKYVLDPMTYQPLQVPGDSARDPVSPAPSEPTPRAQPNSLPPGPTRTGSNSSIGSQPAVGIELASVLASGHIEIVDPLPERFATGLEGRGFGDTPRAAALLPISTSFGRGTNRGGKPLPQAVLLVGQNTRRPYDADYAAWLESMCVALSNQLTVILQREADMKMMEEREKMDKAKTLFFTNASHELRTPLTLIQAPLEQLLSSQNMMESSRYKVQLALRNAKRLRKLVDSILDMSKLEAGRLRGYFRPVQLGRITSDLAALFRSMAEKKGIAFEVVDDNINPPLVYVDVDFWEKITCNLLSNAFKYTVKGKVTISVTYDSSSAYMHIQDTGVGIPKEHLDQVFERFHRVAEGTGIGLSLTKELVGLHGGELSVTSRSKQEDPGHTGSTFTVKIPQGYSHLPESLVHETGENKTHGISANELEYWMGSDIEQATPSIASTDDEGESAASSTLFFEKDDTILVVDDNEDMRSYIRKIFSPYLKVLEARDGFEALSIIRLQKLNAILCDVMMPEMSGLELLAKLRKEKRTRLVPVIFVTASDDVNLISGKTEGVVDCITKPFRVRDLLARVHLQVQLGKRRINLEEEFEVRSRELQVLTDLSPVGIFRTDASGKLTYLNPTWYQVTGFPPDRDREEWLDHIHPVSTQDALRVWRACFEDHKTSSVRLRWKPDIWTHACISPMFAPDDAFAGAFGTITDITDQHRAEEARIALAEEKEHIAAMKAKDAEEQRLFEVERRRAQELLIDVTSHELRQPVSDCRKRNVSYIPTDRVLDELEDDLQAMESITQLTGVRCGLAQARIANDVLSLSRIQLNVLSIIPTEFDIRRETGQILMVFRNELASRSKSGEFLGCRKDIDIKLDLGRGADLIGCTSVCTDRSRFAQIITNLMSNAIRFTDMSADIREIRVSLEIALDPPADNTCAPPLILSGRPAHSRSPESESGTTPVYIYVSVKDSGPGLQKEDLALLFQRFQQGSNAHHVFGGSGLGLIEVESEVGKGAMFRFFIKGTMPGMVRTGQEPMVARVRRSASIHSRASGVSKTSGKSGSRPLPETPNLRLHRPLHVLITEDNKVNQVCKPRQMKRAGFTYSLASNGLEAVHAIESADAAESSGLVPGMFDVVLMDLEMPVMDGFAATREIRKKEASKSLKLRSFIIVLTGNARIEQVEAARQAGADDVMIKPYQIESLIAKMRAGYQPPTSASTIIPQ
ncbi:response regulator receiver [Ceratobasidium sp. AG-Ba]|nr:response regulator receiver [Ceratobasidium sp. AG-Ba]